jgi:hypothetical protein
MKKKIKFQGKLFNKEITITIDENSKPSPMIGLVARKLEKANESLSKMKSLPKLSLEE